MPHDRSTIALCTQLDAECDQQVTVVGRPLTALGRLHRRQLMSTNECRLFVALGDGRRAVAQFLKSRVWDKILKGRISIFGDTFILILLK